MLFTKAVSKNGNTTLLLNWQFLCRLSGADAGSKRRNSVTCACNLRHTSLVRRAISRMGELRSTKPRTYPVMMGNKILSPMLFVNLQ